MFELAQRQEICDRPDPRLPASEAEAELQRLAA
jgi:hypothetical protein